MKTEMYLPSTGGHYLASASQLASLERVGWVRYADWLKQQGTAPTPPPAPAPAPVPEPEPEPEPVDTKPVSTNNETVPAPTL